MVHYVDQAGQICLLLVKGMCCHAQLLPDLSIIVTPGMLESRILKLSRWVKAYCFAIVLLGFGTVRLLAWNNMTSEILSRKHFNKESGVFHRCDRKSITQPIKYEA